jgi:DNA gyrase/topoisomerase IV subunit B
MSKEQKLAKEISTIEHMRSKTMWSGSHDAQNIQCYILKDNKFVLTTLVFPPALYKIIDEVIANSTDHHVAHPSEVTKIKINFTSKGQISVYNNGPGIPVVMSERIDGKKIYIAELIATIPLSGNNFDDDGTNTKGGTNGVGLKLAGSFSKELILETVDSVNQKYYKQRNYDRLRNVEPPIVEDSDLKPYTKITFTPSYSEAFKKYKIKDNYETILSILEVRAWFAAAYVDARVYFNDSEIKINSFQHFCQMFSESEIVTTKISAKMMLLNQTNSRKKSEKYSESENTYNWEIGVGLSNGKSQSFSLVNGIYIWSGGSHIKFIQNQISDKLKNNVLSLLKSYGQNTDKFNNNTHIHNHLMIFMKGTIPSPSFNSQTKESISDPKEKYEKFILPESFCKNVWSKLLEKNLQKLLATTLISNISNKKKDKKIIINGYEEASNCKKESLRHKCGLIICEGESAKGTADGGLTSGIPDFNKDWYGIISIQGVMVNALKECTEFTNKNGEIIPIKNNKYKYKLSDMEEIEILTEKKKSKYKDIDDLESNDEDLKFPSDSENSDEEIDDDINDHKYTIRFPKQKLINNKRIQELMSALNLDYGKKYEKNTIGDTEFKTLRYGFIIGLTDQDLDGFNIFGLLITFILSYWPGLVERGFIRRIKTPIIRAYPIKKKEYVKEFYSIQSYETWMDSIGRENITKNFQIKYYKGLGSHDRSLGEIKQMFNNIKDKINVYILDKHAIKNMYIYYGCETSNRKLALATPSKNLYNYDNFEINISDHFNIQSKEYQRDNIIRKLSRVSDGLVESRRKILYTARLNENHGEMKVPAFAGKVMDNANYQHGDLSLVGTIIKMAQRGAMARNLPLLEPMGNFGSRKSGYKDAAAGRYIYVKYYKQLANKIFPREDDNILEYTIDDGHTYEPKTYLPIIPYILCENLICPATGWSISIHARHIDDIFNNIRKRIYGTYDKCKLLRRWDKDFKGSIVEYKNSTYSVGKYIYDEQKRLIHITELPYGVYSSIYIHGSSSSPETGIIHKELIDNIKDETNDDEVNIYITLKQDAIEKITDEKSTYGNETFDPIIEYLGLKSPMFDKLNLINDEDKVQTYTSYETIFDDWYEMRKSAYKKRIEREILLCKLRIEFYENIHKFCMNYKSYNITTETPIDDIIIIIKSNNYKKFNKSKLHSPIIGTDSAVVESITVKNATYDYLIDLSFRELSSKEETKIRLDKIETDKQKIIKLSNDGGYFIGAPIWLEELDILESFIKKYMPMRWMDESKKPLFN